MKVYFDYEKLMAEVPRRSQSFVRNSGFVAGRRGVQLFILPVRRILSWW